MNNFLLKIYSYSFFDDLILIYPLYAVMFVDFGLTALEISLMLMIWSGTAFLLEMPSGVIADKYSRKAILFIAQLMRIVGYSVWLIFPSFWGFLIGFILWGIKSAFTSGTFEALMYDELKQNNLESEYTKVLGKQRAIKFAALTIAGLGATIAINSGYQFVLVISLVSLALSAFSILLLPSAKKSQSTHEKEYFKMLKRGLTSVMHTPAILEMIIFISLAHALFGALEEYWGIFAHDVGLSKAGLGMFFVIYGAGQASASLCAYKFATKSRKFFYALFLLNGIFLFIASYFYQALFLPFIILITFIFKLVDTVAQGHLQYKIPTESRATISSVNGFFVELAIVIFNMGFGFIAGSNHYRLGFIMSAIMICIIGLFYLILPNINKSKAFS